MHASAQLCGAVNGSKRVGARNWWWLGNQSEREIFCSLSESEHYVDLQATYRNRSVRVAVLVFFLVEPERKSALGILLYFSGRKGNAEKRSEEATDIIGGIAAVNMAHKGGTCEPLRDRLAPFHNSTVDSVLLQKGKDLLGDLVGGIGGGGTRSDADPYDDGTETPLRVLSQRCVGEEAGRVDRRPVDLPSLDQVTNLGTDSVLDTIERGVEDSAERLDGDVGVSADGLGEGHSEEIRTVDEARVVAVPGDAVII